MEILVWYPRGSKELGNWFKIYQKYPEVKIFVYEDSGVDLSLYISQLRPHSLKKHFKERASLLKDKVFFYHDSDIIFNYLPDFTLLLQDEKVNLQSDCSNYLDYNYLRRKEKQGNIPEHEAIQVLADIGNIPIETIKNYSNKTGGAQTILRGIDSGFWQDVEDQSIAIRKAFAYQMPDSINRKHFSSEDNGFQSWCADMWALNFAQWNRGFITDVTDKLAFSWATDAIETYNQRPIFHNAGANGKQEGVFYKGAYINKSPIGNLDLPYDETKASSKYVEAIWNVK
jgi:hypothetical protein